MISRPRPAVVREVHQLSEDVKLIAFDDEYAAGAKPGQFIMVWIPGVDEIPMSVSLTGPRGEARIIVKRVGEATAALHDLRPGSAIGVRGPYGNWFTIEGRHALVVAGGVGVAPLLPLAKTLTASGVRTTFIFGARTRADLFLLDEIKSLAGGEHDVLIATEDGSYGRRGLASDLAAEILLREKVDIVYTCGKEQLMRRVLELAELAKIKMQASLERYIKCGIGICGHCVLDPLGLRVCRDGPVFSSEQLKRIADFGAYKRDPTGRRVSV